MELLPSIVIVGGWGCGEQAMAAWAPFYASHGIVAMVIGTPAPWTDSPAARCKALLDASSALQSEHEREGSALLGRLDVSRRAVQGYSLGGGGAQLAALTRPLQHGYAASAIVRSGPAAVWPACALATS